MNTNEIRYGILMLAGFIGFFFLMKALGLYTQVELRALNIVIHGAVVYAAMRAYRKTVGGEFKYLPTFAVGMRTSIIPVLAFAFFQYIYLTLIEPSYMAYIHDNAVLGHLLTPYTASLFLILEGFGVSIFTSYVGMRLLTIQENVPSLS